MLPKSIAFSMIYQSIDCLSALVGEEGSETFSQISETRPQKTVSHGIIRQLVAFLLNKVDSI
jgi:hypothetical protein